MPNSSRYNYQHRQARKTALARLQDGDPCCRCGGPMFKVNARQLDLDHNDDHTTYRGLAHATCNRRAGTARREQLRRRRVPNTWNSRTW